jgi:dihydrofolate synthase/folylpolyglutamate synthase
MGLNRVGELTAFQGRWQQFGESPLKICDTGHNTEAFKFIVEQALRSTNGTIHWVLGAASDKDIDGFLNQLPKQRSQYYWTSTNSPRCLSGSELAKRAQTLRPGPFFKSVQEALAAAEVNANPEDLIFVGGSTFVVADLTLIP